MKKVDHILIAIMLNEPLPQSFSYFSLTARFKDEFNDIFGTTEPIPTGQGNMPPEIPRYSLQTDDLKYSFSFSGLRFDFNFNKISNFTMESLDKYIHSIEMVLSSLALPPVRIGVVVDGIILPESSVEDYLSQFINMANLTKPMEYQFSYREIISNNGYNYNKWTRHGGLKDNKELNFQLDINSANELPTSQLNSVYSQVIKKEIGDYIGS